MKLIEKLSQSRRDFQGKYKCEFCHNIETDETMSSYDDEYYHTSVIPNIKCKKCGKSTINQKEEIINNMEEELDRKSTRLNSSHL